MQNKGSKPTQNKATQIKNINERHRLPATLSNSKQQTRKVTEERNVFLTYQTGLTNKEVLMWSEGRHRLPVTHLCTLDL